MKKPYQIEAQRAVKQLEAMANDGNPAVQMILPMAEMVSWLRKGVGELVRQAGLQLMDLLMQEEVRELVGERSQRQAERTANRWGSEQGYCVVMGQKVPVKRPRVRTTEDMRLGSYEMLHRGEPLTETMWEKLMLGLSTRKYGARPFASSPRHTVWRAHRDDRRSNPCRRENWFSAPSGPFTRSRQEFSDMTRVPKQTDNCHESIDSLNTLLYNREVVAGRTGAGGR
jgi:hypothetical protein